MDGKNRESSGDSFCSFSLEALEERKLLAGWASTIGVIDQDTASKVYKKYTGKGQAIAILDTGVDYNHPALGGRWGKTVIAGYDFVNNDKDPMDETGHGTEVAGMVSSRLFTYGGVRYRGIATGAKIVALRIEDDSDYLPDSRIEKALQWVITNRNRYNITAVNMSLGDGDYSKDFTRAPYGDELAELHRQGVFITAASGNDGISKPGINYPAADPNVVAVGSINGADVISKFTSRAGNLDLLAPGEGVGVPTTVGGRYIYVKGSGTSYAAPVVAGAAMILHQANPSLSSSEILSILKSSGSKNWDGDAEYPATYLTYRRLDLDNAIRTALSRKHRKSAAQRRVRPAVEADQPQAQKIQKKPIFNSANRISFD